MKPSYFRPYFLPFLFSLFQIAKASNLVAMAIKDMNASDAMWSMWLGYVNLEIASSKDVY